MDYSKLSDFEINKSVAHALWPKCKTHNVEIQEPCVCVLNDGGPVYSNYDPCNNPNHAWPIILNNAIQMNYDTCEVHCDSYFAPSAGKVSAPHKRALRAAMIVYLKMKAA